ncbi:MAG: class II aldolase/adducin family protein, partial [Lysobacteraceae bacterium]
MQRRKTGVFASDSHAYQGQAHVTMNQRIASAEDHSLPADSASSAPEELVRVSAKIGGNAHLVQGGGGNTSFKRDDDFWVKASGTWLAEAETRDIFVRLSLAAVRKTMSGADIEAGIAALGPAGGLRPSIETSLHALLPHTAV